ncbi:MAG: Mu-like prophage major head subunit gpT family protein [Planctomycetes bacterium]|nr:Mu-like prophage major head subunit gpT family protein [Planctomycetota bacterium]
MTKNNSRPPENFELTAAVEIDLTAENAGSPTTDQNGGGKLPRFSMVAYTGGPMRIAGWRYPVVVDLAGLAIPSQSRPIRFGHDANSGVGHSDSIRVQEGMLVATGVVSRDTSAAKEIVASAKNGFPWQASIGASVDEFEFVKAEQMVLVNGNKFTGPLNVVRKATLGEISFVDLGADGNTSASVAATAREKNIMDDRENVEQGKLFAENDADREVHVAAGSDRGQPSGSGPVVKSQATAGTDAGGPGIAPPRSPAMQPPQAQVPQTPQPAQAQPPALKIQAADAPAEPSAAARTVAEMRAAVAAEQDRINAVKKVCGDSHADIAAKAIAEGWDVTRTELEVLRADRPKPPAVQIPDNYVGQNVLEAACMLTGRHADAEKLYDEKTLELAAKKFRGGLGLQELLLEAAWANGFSGKNFRDSREVLRFAFGQDVQAGFSTVDIGGILSNVSNKFLLEGFFSVEGTWRNICAIRNVSDFKTVTSYRLIGKDQYEIVAPGGQLKHGTLGNESYTNRADTYGLLLAIDRRDIINDDLGAITTVPRKLGRGSGLKINDIFWTIFMNNASFFTAGNANYLTGADTALAIESLSRAEKTFMDMKDSDGKPIGIMPAVLLVPTALSAIATQLYKATELRDNTTGKGAYPTSNPHQGKYRVEVSRYLSSSAYAGNSDKAWYLLADPSDLPVIEAAFLNGNESPTIETAEADFNVLGIQMRGYHDFGCALQDSRGGVKSKGEI